jgi:hypothetical protein
VLSLGRLPAARNATASTTALRWSASATASRSKSSRIGRRGVGSKLLRHMERALQYLHIL